MKSNKVKIFLGFSLTIIGVLIGLVNFNIINKDIFFDGWWTLFIIIPSIIGLFTDEDKASSLKGLIFGVVLLLIFQDVLSMEIVGKLIFPIVLISIGTLLIFNPYIKKKVIKSKSSTTFFSTNRITPVDVNQLDLFTMFGETIVDLTNTNMDEVNRLDLSLIFGSVIIYLPSDFETINNVTSIFSDVSDRRADVKKTKKKLEINGLSLFGDIKIR